jgi:hypothetical protein
MSARKIKQSELTPWFPVGVNPVHPGEYNASVGDSMVSLRWWDGVGWSSVYWSGESREVIRCARSSRSTWSANDIRWRGLSEKPA